MRFSFLAPAALLAAGALALGETKTYFSADPAQQQLLWDDFKATFGRTYESRDDEAARFRIFVDNLKLIDERNAAEAGTAQHGVSPFADLTPAEFRRSFLNHDPVKAAGNQKRRRDFAAPAPLLRRDSDLVDWTGVYTTPVKYQGFCGSCWAFSAVEQIESDYLRTGGNSSIWEPTPDKGLSVQQPTSCVVYPKPGVGGCDGGWTENVFEYAEAGLETDFDYPYTSSTGGTPKACEADPALAVVKTTGYTRVSSSPEDEEAMAAYVQTTGPLSVCVDASEWGTYTSGVLSTCGQAVDHCVQAVGIDTKDGYWKVRNSWGTAWGERGFIRVQYGNNTCNITSDSNFAEVTLA